MIRLSVKIAILGVLLIGLAACAASTLRQYPGPELPSDQTALIESGPYTHIEALDGQGVNALRVAVLPGSHTVVMRPAEQEQPLRTYLFYSLGPGTVRFNAEAGHRYLAYVEFVTTEGPADEQKGSGYVWIGYISDRSTGKKLANTGPLPLGVEPRFFPSGGPISGSIGGGAVLVPR